MDRPRNPRLYEALVAAFGRVKIINPGRPLQVVGYVPDIVPRPNRRLRARYGEYGETYQLCCPFCADGRDRLWVNHRWCQRDPVNGDSNFHLVKCFNEDCVADGEHQQKLREMVFHPPPPQEVKAPGAASSGSGKSPSLRSQPAPERKRPLRRRLKPRQPMDYDNRIHGRPDC